jgi:hypothetical protein
MELPKVTWGMQWSRVLCLPGVVKDDSSFLRRVQPRRLWSVRKTMPGFRFLAATREGSGSPPRSQCDIIYLTLHEPSPNLDRQR